MGPPRPGPLPPSTSATHEYRLDRATNKNDHPSRPAAAPAVADIRSETPAGFGSEQVAGFILECVAGFVGIRTPERSAPQEPLPTAAHRSGAIRRRQYTLCAAPRTGSRDY